MSLPAPPFSVSLPQRVVAVQTSQGVGCGIAGETVRQLVAGAIDDGRPCQEEVLQVGRQRVGHARLHRVGPLASRLGDGVATVHHVGVVAQTADQGVVAGPAVQRVVAVQTSQGVGCRIARQAVGQRIAGQTERYRVGQLAVLDVPRQGVEPPRRGGTHLHRVDARALSLHHRVIGVVHHVGVVARPADHAVAAQASHQAVIPAASVQGVVAGRAIQGVVAVQPVQHVVAAVAREAVGKVAAGEILEAEERVGACPRDLRGRRGEAHRHAARGVLVGSGIEPGPAVQNVVSGIARNHVV